ncbi:hypothetical protein [Rhizobium sp. ZX09]|uniref:hypothetical protein n=1 Tax=Rhizobium sp. ZX09 TaxID=2291939 RepID=UPI001A99E4DB|nr:hypothetical protein [Rhizobium sp. ZX09]QSZ56960.1 hypothetical protein BTN45_07440 [Rhizobium sp. ZX09]
MSEQSETGEKITVIPHQDYVTFEVFDDTIWITQEGYAEGDQTISIIGRANLDLMISALSKVREKWS